MTIPLAVNFGVSQRAPQQTLPGILGIEAGKSADVAFAQSCPQFRGGLPPRVLRRVREYIEAHLENNVSLEVLAGIASLSISYFARAFKQSEGVAPHDYLMRRRVQRALELLAGTDLPLFPQLRMPRDSRIRVISRAGSGNISVSRRAAIDG
jgi:AraC-like DNA-binding protein